MSELEDENPPLPRPQPATALDFSAVDSPVEEDEENMEPVDTSPTARGTTVVGELYDCPYCEKSFDNYNSLASHVSMMNRHHDDHPVERFKREYEHLKEQDGKDTKSKKKTSVSRGSSAVKLQPVEATFDPAEAFEIKTLKKRTAILEEKLHQKGIEDKLGIPQVQEAQAQAMFDSQAREEDLLKSKDREIARLHEMREKEKDRAHEKEIAQIKNTHNIELKFKEMDYKFQIEMAKMKADVARDVSDVKTEVNKTMVRGVNTFVDLLVEDYKHKKAIRERDHEKLEQLHTQIAEEGGDGGILSMINPKFRRE